MKIIPPYGIILLIFIDCFKKDRMCAKTGINKTGINNVSLYTCSEQLQCKSKKEKPEKVLANCVHPIFNSTNGNHNILKSCILFAHNLYKRLLQMYRMQKHLCMGEEIKYKSTLFLFSCLYFCYSVERSSVLSTFLLQMVRT